MDVGGIDLRAIELSDMRSIGFAQNLFALNRTVTGRGDRSGCLAEKVQHVWMRRIAGNSLRQINQSTTRPVIVPRARACTAGMGGAERRLISGLTADKDIGGSHGGFGHSYRDRWCG